jgi:hypothetical protein
MTSVDIFVPKDSNSSKPGTLLRLGTYSATETVFEGSTSDYLPDQFRTDNILDKSISSATGSSAYGSVRLNGEGNVIFSAVEEVFVEADGKIDLKAGGNIGIATDDGSNNSISISSDETVELEGKNITVSVADTSDASYQTKEEIVDDYFGFTVGNFFAVVDGTEDYTVLGFKITMDFAPLNISLLAAARFRYLCFRYNYTRISTSIFGSVIYQSTFMFTRKLQKLKMNYGISGEMTATSAGTALFDLALTNMRFNNGLAKVNQSLIDAGQAHLQIHSDGIELDTSGFAFYV